MSNEEIPFREKIRTIQFAGSVTKPRVSVKDDKKHVEMLTNDGENAGWEIHHKDGRQDAHAKLESAEVVISL